MKFSKNSKSAFFGKITLCCQNLKRLTRRHIFLTIIPVIPVNQIRENRFRKIQTCEWRQFTRVHNRLKSVFHARLYRGILGSWP